MFGWFFTIVGWLIFGVIIGAVARFVLPGKQEMSLLMTAKAAGIHAGDYFRDVLTRISTCTDAKLLTPYGWKQHFEAEVTGRRHALIEQIVRSA